MVENKIWEIAAKMFSKKISLHKGSPLMSSQPQVEPVFKRLLNETKLVQAPFIIQTPKWF